MFGVEVLPALATKIVPESTAAAFQRAGATLEHHAERRISALLGPDTHLALQKEAARLSWLPLLKSRDSGSIMLLVAIVIGPGSYNAHALSDIVQSPSWEDS